MIHDEEIGDSALSLLRSANYTESSLGVIGRTLAAPFANEAKLQAGLRHLLDEFQDEGTARMWLNPGGVVVEALLFHCHDSSGTTNALHIGKIADTATAILQGRGETFLLKAKTAGGILRQLELFPKRTARGFALLLNEITRRRIHELARKWDVPATRIRDFGEFRYAWALLRVHGLRCKSIAPVTYQHKRFRPKKSIRSLYVLSIA